MVTPSELKVNAPTYDTLAKAVAGGARKLSDVASTLTKNADPVVDHEVNTALAAALGKCATQLYSVHGQLEQAAWAVMRAGKIFPWLDRSLKTIINDPYATRAPTHPWKPGDIGSPFFPLSPQLQLPTEEPGGP